MCTTETKLQIQIIYFGVLVSIQFRIDKKQKTDVLEVLDTGQGSQLAKRFGKYEQSTPNLFKPNRENAHEDISHATSTMGSIFKEHFVHPPSPFP